METIQITKDACHRMVDDDRLFYEGYPLNILTSDPQPNEILARKQLEEREAEYAIREHADMQYKYTMGGVRIWSANKIPVLHINDAITETQMSPEGTVTAYELFALSGVKPRIKT